MKGVCAVCKQKGDVQRHHILPRRFFGRGNRNRQVIILCPKDHFAIEKIIEREEFDKGGAKRKQLTRERYFKIVQEFFDRSWEHG